MTEACCYCGATTRELRPYGPEAAPVCHPCATSPERVHPQIEGPT